MSMPQPDSTQAQPLSAIFAATAAAPPSEPEHEVIALFDAHRTRLLRYVSAFGIAGHDGEEVVQEVFLSLFRHLQKGKSRSNLRGWIFRVAHNLALRQRETNQRWHNVIEWNNTIAAQPHDPSPNPEQQAAAAQRQQRLLSVVRALPEQDRYCLALRAEGLRYREIANVLGISLGAVSISLTRSITRLTRADETRREPAS